MKPFDDSDLREPAPRMARVAALALLERVRAARDRLDDPNDTDSLHDFRVALRKLRSWLRTFRGVLADTVNKKPVRRLKRIADATAGSRDLEVHIEWTTHARRTLRSGGRPGADWLLARLQDRKASSDLAFRQVLDADYPRALEDVARALQHFQAAVVDRDVVFAGVTAELLREHAGALGKALRAVGGPGDRVEAHEARIAAKRLRYLLERFEGTLKPAVEVVKELTRMQDVLGELHDAQLFGGEVAASIAAALAERTGSGAGSTSPDAPVPGLLALSQRLRRAEDESFALAKSSWFDDAAAPLLGQVIAIANDLHELAGEGREIERKYLLRRLPDMPEARVVVIDQGYLPGKRLIERIRRVTSDEGARYYRTVKSGRGVDRLELEEETTRQVFNALWRTTSRRRVRKRRHMVEVDGYTWEVDEFLDRDLVLVEVELERADDTPEMPAWLSDVLDREVTEEEKYSNRSLAK